MLPFAFHRPYARQLADGRVLVTGRHVNGGLGTYAWCGDLHAEAGQHQIGGPRCEYSASLAPEALIVDNRPDRECRYTLLPPESPRSQVTYQARLRVEGPADQAVAFLSLNVLLGGRGPLVLHIAPNRVWFMVDGPSFSRQIDMTRYHTLKLHHRRGLLRVYADGQPLFDTRVMREGARLADFYGGDVTRRTQFGQLGDRGRSFWRQLSYDVQNPSLDDHSWTWQASSGKLPDDYQRRRLIQMHGNAPGGWPDHGYSSWLPLEDGRIFLVDYTNYGDKPGKSHLVGVYVDAEDIA
jgi:hypothetical protein